MTTRADTIARLVNAYTDALGVVVSNTVGYMAAANSLERGDIQRDLHAAMERSRQHLHLAFLECLGGTAVAGEAAEGPLRMAYPDGVPVTTPEPPKPAGWVVRAKHPAHGVVYVVTADGGTGYCHPTKAHAFATEADAHGAAYTRTWGSQWTRTILPVDAAGNVIEAAGEEREWEAMRADRDAFKAEAERLRGDVAAVKAERDAARAAARDVDDLRLRCRESAEVLERMTAARDTMLAYHDTHLSGRTVSMRLADRNERALVDLARRIAEEPGRG